MDVGIEGRMEFHFEPTESFREGYEKTYVEGTSLREYCFPRWKKTF